MTTETREQVIEAAEVLFARNGYSATSLREITETARVNIAAVNYHFGSKEKLLIEILDRVVGPINAKRMNLLDQIETAGEATVVEVLTAFLLPDLQVLNELRARNPELPRFVSRMYSEGTELMTRIMGRQFAEVQTRFYRAFEKALPDIERDDIAWRLHCVVGIVVYLFAGVETPEMPSMLGTDVDANLEKLLEVTTPLMTAPKREAKSTMK
ncbi:MAG: TetR/AcrR family transcriptional regulator [Actinomycetota bacterium]|nr:TetR/AcrR family transcriptional regulator [Actinomycetota bacterium]